MACATHSLPGPVGRTSRTLTDNAVKFKIAHQLLFQVKNSGEALTLSSKVPQLSSSAVGDRAAQEESRQRRA